MNLELQKKIKNAMNETFVGNYMFTDEELCEMIEELSRSFNRVCNTWGETLSLSQYELTFVVLVNLTKLWNATEDTWLDFLYKKLLGRQSLENEPTGKAYGILKTVYENLVSKDKIFYFNSFTKRYYATITSHAMAPKETFFSFFDMCWRIYCDDLNQEYVKNDNAFTLIAQSLNNKLGGIFEEDEDLKIGSQVYALRASITGLIKDRPDIFVSLIDDTICSINTLFNSEPISKDTYLHLLIAEWWLIKEDSFGQERKNRITLKERIVTDYSQIRVKYIIVDGDVKLHIPSFRLLSDFNYLPCVEIQSNGELVFSGELIATGSGILMGTKPYNISLNELQILNLSDIKVIITHSGKVLYDSKDTLNRDFVLLNDKKEIIAQDCLPDNYYLYISDFRELTRYPNDIQRISTKTFSLNAEEGEVLQGKAKTVFFINEKKNRDLYLFARERGDIVFRLNGEEYKIIDGDLYVDILDSIETRGYGVRYNDASFRLIDFESISSEGRRRFNISNILNSGEAQHICVFQYRDNSIVSAINLVKFDDISIEYDKPYYYGDNLCGTVKFKTKKFESVVNFDASNNEILVPVADGEVLLYPPTIKWRIDDGIWNCSARAFPVWYKNHHNASCLQVQIPKNIAFSVGLGNYLLRTTEKSSEFDLGKLLFFLKETESVDELPLFIRTDNELLSLETIVIKEKFVGDPITINSIEKKVYWNPEYFIGDDKADFEIRFYRENKLLANVKCDNSRKRTYSVSFDDDYYEIEVNYLPKGFIKKSINWSRKKCVFGNEKSIRFKNKAIALRKVAFLGSTEPENIRPLYIDNLKYLGEYENSDIYSGELFFINNYSGVKTRVKIMKDANGQNVQINPLRIELRTNLTCYIGYGLIQNGDEFDYDNEFTLDWDGKISVSQKVNGRKNRSIDYYIMEVIKDV